MLLPLPCKHWEKGMAQNRMLSYWIMTSVDCMLLTVFLNKKKWNRHYSTINFSVCYTVTWPHHYHMFVATSRVEQNLELNLNCLKNFALHSYEFLWILSHFNYTSLYSYSNYNYYASCLEASNSGSEMEFKRHSQFSS